MQLPDMSIEPKTGRWLLLSGPRSMNATMLTAIARLGERGDLRVYLSEYPKLVWLLGFPTAVS